MVKLLDKFNNEANIGDIIKVENYETGKVFYYLYGKSMLYRYNNQGGIDEESFNNIKVDGGLNFDNDNVWEWTRLGNKEDVYNNIFK